MKKLLYLAILSLVATLVIAPAALAQGGPYCPEDQFPASAPGDPGEASLMCFDTAEEAQIYSGTGEIPAEEPPVTEEPPTTTGTQYETPQAPQPPATPQATEPLPDTGGPGVSALLLPAAALLLTGGLIGLRVARRS